jgi:hypothetical protein
MVNIIYLLIITLIVIAKFFLAKYFDIDISLAFDVLTILTAALWVKFNIKEKLQSSKNLANFNCFIKKKHAVYGDFYELFKNAESLLDIFGFVESRNFHGWTPHAIEEYINKNEHIKFRIEGEDKKNMINKEKKALEKLCNLDREKEVYDKENDYRKAKNYWLRHRIYFSDSIDSKLKAFFEVLDNWNQFHIANASMRRDTGKKNQDKVNQLSEEILKAMKQEIEHLH